jgi:putative phage-type endonuclease
MIRYHPDMEQGSEEWLAARCGLLTASEMANIITPSLKPSANEKTRTHLYELLAQRITQHVEPHYISDDMLRGHEDEIEARALYERHYGEVTQCGFVTNDRWGFTIGCSPDGLVGEDGLIEIKSRRQRFQVATIVSRQMPTDYLMQVQTALLVTERDWCDFISYSGGLPMATIRVWPDEKVQAAIIEAATTFEETLAAMLDSYHGTLASGLRLVPTERRIEQEMTI